MKQQTAATAALGLAITLAWGTAPAASLQTYAFSDAAQSLTTTHGPPPDPSGFYVTYSGKVAPGYDLTIPVSQDYQTSATGPVSSSSQASGGGNSTWGVWSGTGTSHSSAAYGSLAVDATAAVANALGGDGNSMHGSMAWAIAKDTYTITGGSGAAVFRPIYSVSGTLTNNHSELGLHFDYQINASPALMAYRLTSSNYGAPTIYYNGYQSSLPGITIAGSNIGGTTNISFDVAFNFGSSFDLTTALYGVSAPNVVGDGSVYGSLQLVGWEILQGGNPVTGASIQSASGIVPVPAAAWLFAPAIVLLAPFRRRAG